MKPKKNPQDATRRNVQAANKRIAALRKHVGEQDARIYALEQDVKMLTHLAAAEIRRANNRSKRK